MSDTVSYLPIVVDEYEVKHLQHFTNTWSNYLKECDWDTTVARQRLSKEYNGTLINDAIIFASEKDKIMWMLRWS